EEEASDLLGRRGSRLLVRVAQGAKALQPRQHFDGGIEREFPAFRALELAEVAATHVLGQRGGGGFPERRPKHGALPSARRAARNSSRRRWRARSAARARASALCG